MAGLLYLPRIFVYHAENFKDDNSSNIFKTMEKNTFSMRKIRKHIESIRKLFFDIRKINKKLEHLEASGKVCFRY